MDVDHIRHLWQNGEVEYSEEAQDRLWQREVTTDNIGEAIQNGRIMEERPGYPYPKCLVQGWATRKAAGLDIGLQLFNVACAMGEDLHIITVYWEK